MSNAIINVKRKLILSNEKQKESPVASGALLPSKKPLGFKSHCIFHKFNLPRLPQFPQIPQTAYFVECNIQINDYIFQNMNKKYIRSLEPEQLHSDLSLRRHFAVFRPKSSKIHKKVIVYLIQ